MWSRPFGIYLGGLSADLLGDSLWFVGLAWAVASTTSPASASLILAAATIPRVLLMLPAGSLVDRVGAMKVAQGAQLLRTATMAVLVLALVGGIPLPALVVASMVFGAADALRMPASGSLLPSLLQAKDLPAGQGVVSTIYRVATVLAAPAAGALLAWRGLQAVVIVNVLLFGSALAAYALLARRGVGAVASDDEPAAGVRAGLAYVRTRPAILTMLVVISLINLAVAGPLELGLALRSRQQDWGAGGLGVLFGAFSLGATVGALSLSRWRPKNPARAGYLCSAVAGVALVPLAIAPGLAMAATAVALCGLGFGPAGGLLLGGIQAATQPAHMGRVMSLITLSSIGTAPIGLLLFGALIGLVSVAAAMAVSGAVIVGAALIAATSSHTVAAFEPEGNSSLRSD